MINKNKALMMGTGLLGLVFFIIANCTNYFEGANIAAGLIQLAINAAVFLAWGRNFLQTHGKEKLVSFGGVLFPPVMAGITVWGVLLPALIEALK